MTIIHDHEVQTVQDISDSERAARQIEAQHYGRTVHEHRPGPVCNAITPAGRCRTRVNSTGQLCVFHGYTPPAVQHGR